MQESYLKKKTEFANSIRKQSIFNKMRLKRIQPQMIESNQHAHTLLIHSIQILKSQQNDYQTVAALKSILQVTQKFHFARNMSLIIKLKSEIVSITKDLRKSDIFLQLSTQILKCLCILYPNLITFHDINYEILATYNSLTSVKNILFSLAHLINEIDSIAQLDFKYIYDEVKIFRYFNQILINYKENKMILNKINHELLFCGIVFSYIVWKWGISIQQKDFLTVLQYCVNTIENQILHQAQRDISLEVFFDKKSIQQEYTFTRNISITDYFIQYSYPFPLLQMTIEIVKQVNCDVVFVMMECLEVQVKEVKIQKALLKCLVKILMETEMHLLDPLKQAIFQYIFDLKRVNQPNNGHLLDLLSLVYNHSINWQVPDSSFFNAMAQPNNPYCFRTSKLMELSQYLKLNEDQACQNMLFQIIKNYLILNGSSKALEEDLMYFPQTSLGKRICELYGVKQQQWNTIYQRKQYSQQQFQI